MIEAVFQELEASGSDAQGLQTVSLVQVRWKQGWAGQGALSWGPCTSATGRTPYCCSPGAQCCVQDWRALHLGLSHLFTGVGKPRCEPYTGLGEFSRLWPSSPLSRAWTRGPGGCQQPPFSALCLTQPCSRSVPRAKPGTCSVLTAEPCRRWTSHPWACRYLVPRGASWGLIPQHPAWGCPAPSPEGPGQAEARDSLLVCSHLCFQGDGGGNGGRCARRPSCHQRLHVGAGGCPGTTPAVPSRRALGCTGVRARPMQGLRQGLVQAPLTAASPQGLQPLHPHCGAAAGGRQAPALSSPHPGVPRTPSRAVRTELGLCLVLLLRARLHAPSISHGGVSRQGAPSHDPGTRHPQGSAMGGGAAAGGEQPHLPAAGCDAAR